MLLARSAKVRIVRKSWGNTATAVGTLARRDWSGADLAARLEVTERTVRREVGRLRDLGYPVHASRGTDGGYRLGAGAAMPPLLLDDDEAVAVAVGLRTAARSRVTGIEETSVRALAKLEQVLPSRLRRRVSALADYTVPIPPRREGTGAAGSCRGCGACAVVAVGQLPQLLDQFRRLADGEVGVEQAEVHGDGFRAVGPRRQHAEAPGSE